MANTTSQNANVQMVKSFTIAQCDDDGDDDRGYFDKHTTNSKYP